MFHARVLRRGFSLWTGFPHARIVRSAASAGHETIHIQRVRFRKPLLSRSRLLGTAIALSSTYAALNWLVDDDEEDGEDEHGWETPRDGHEDEGEGEAEPVLFLPTGFSRPKPKTLYKESDPEQQEYKRFVKDRERQNRIYNQLHGIVRNSLADNENIIRKVGRPRPGGLIWLWIQCPQGPPIEYERPGLEVTEDLTIRRATRPVHEIHHKRLSNVLVPTGAANSLYVDGKLKVAKAWEGLKASLGWEDKGKQKQETITHILTPSSLPRNSTSETPTASASSPSGSGSAVSETGASQQQNETESSPQRFGLSLPPPTNLTLDLSTLRQTYQKQNKHVYLDPPRGNIIVAGLVRVDFERAYFTFNVKAYYDPVAGRYTGIAADLVDSAATNGKPKGGA